LSGFIVIRENSELYFFSRIIMNRREFIEKAGMGAAFALAIACTQSCSESTTPSGPVDFTLDLSQAAYAKLLTKGNYVVANSCVVAYGVDGNYYAATVICSHEGERQVIYDKTNDNYYCTAHGARYSKTGAGMNSTGSRGLTVYKTQLTGTTLRVYS
jgi:cytochrome b6-f complex iron-sulfur subunit